MNNGVLGCCKDPSGLLTVGEQVSIIITTTGTTVFGDKVERVEKNKGTGML